MDLYQASQKTASPILFKQFVQVLNLAYSDGDHENKTALTAEKESNQLNLSLKFHWLGTLAFLRNLEGHHLTQHGMLFFLEGWEDEFSMGHGGCGSGIHDMFLEVTDLRFSAPCVGLIFSQCPGNAQSTCFPSFPPPKNFRECQNSNQFFASSTLLLIMIGLLMEMWFFRAQNSLRSQQQSK